MSKKRTFLVGLVVLLLLLLLVACGEEEGREARATVEQAGEDAAAFTQGFCGAAFLAPLCAATGLVARRMRKR